MVSVTNGSWERSLSTKRRDKEKSATQEQNRNRGQCYGPTPGTTHLMDLVNFSLSILSNLLRLQTMMRISTRSHLSHAFHIFSTCVHLMANSMPSNLTLFLTVHLYAVHGYAATHMHITYIMLLFHSATDMRLHHVFNLCYACPRQYWQIWYKHVHTL